MKGGSTQSQKKFKELGLLDPTSTKSSSKSSKTETVMDLLARLENLTAKAKPKGMQASSSTKSLYKDGSDLFKASNGSSIKKPTLNSSQNQRMELRDQTGSAHLPESDRGSRPAHCAR